MAFPREVEGQQFIVHLAIFLLLVQIAAANNFIAYTGCADCHVYHWQRVASARNHIRKRRFLHNYVYVTSLDDLHSLTRILRSSATFAVRTVAVIS